MNVEGTLILQWKRNGAYYQSELEKQKIYALFKGIMEGFGDDNEISTKLVEIIPEASHLIIDWDINTTRDSSIAYVIEDIVEVIQIKYHHKIVWEIFSKYCNEEKDELKISPEKFMNF